MFILKQMRVDGQNMLIRLFEKHKLLKTTSAKKVWFCLDFDATVLVKKVNRPRYGLTKDQLK